jgi:arylformamidase
MKLIDLTVPINEQTPVYPGDPATKIEPAGVFDRDGFNDHYISIGTHVGTHIDAPFHMIPDGKTLDKIPIDNFIGRGVYIKIETERFDLAQVQAADIRSGDIVLFHTGLSKIYHDPKYFEYPEIPEGIANYLVEKKVKMVGVDMASPDHPPYKIHKILLGADILIIENLTNLSDLAGKEFTVYALPLKLQIDGSPARVIAQIK